MGRIGEGSIRDLPREVLREIFDHARSEYPNEACGLVLLDGGGRLSVRRCENLQDRLHQLDPERYPRTARTAYNLDPREFLRAEREGKRVAVLYHSHCDTGAYFSEEDEAAALFGGAPAYPGVAYLVVSVEEGRIGEIALFAWDAGARAFQRISPPAWR